VLGFYLTSDRDAHKVGVLPAPAFDAAALQGHPIASTHWDGYASNLEVFADAAPGAGFINAVADADGQFRSVPLIAELGGRYYEPLALAMFRSYTGGPRVVPGFAPQGGLPRDYGALQSIVLEQGANRLSLPVDAVARARVPFRGPGGPHGGSFEYVSAADLLSGRVAPAHLAGKLVIVGTTAPGVYDQRSTPVGEVYPGAEVHANLLSGLLDGRLPVQPDWAAGFEIAQLLFVAAVLVAGLPRLRAVRAAQLVLALTALMIALNLWIYRAHAVLLPLAASLVLTALLYVGITLRAFVVEGRQRRALARLFGTYVPPELVAEMARDPTRYDMRAENRVLTIMFCDIRNFTRVSEQMSPEDLRSLVNQFFSGMTTVIRAHRGTLDKYIGDAIMAFWGAPVDDPAHAAHAVQAALLMVERLGALNAELAQRGLPAIGVGIGLNTGLVCVGDMGSSVRRSYTVMGDAVNLASRIEGLTRHYGVGVLVGQATRDAALTEGPGGAPAGLAWVEVDRVHVKGKLRDVTLFTPVAQAVAELPAFQTEMRLWQLALAAYRLQHWDQAQAGLYGLQSSYAGSALAGVYRQLDKRIAHHRSTPPPEDWGGAHTFDSK
jgi:adenylate cyclase